MKKKTKRRRKSRATAGKLKKQFLALGIVLIGGTILIALSMVSDTYSLFVSKDTRSNDFRVSDTRVKLIDEFRAPDQVEINAPYDKKVRVKNTGPSSVFIRVMLQPQLISKQDDKNQTFVLPAEIGKELLIDLNTTNWKYGNDGYYYYLLALSKKEETENIFSTVTLAPSLTDIYSGADFSIGVKVEAVNTAKWSYRTAWWHDDSTVWAAGPLAEIDTELKKSAQSDD